MRYFTLINQDHWVGKNQLHREFKAYVRSINCLILEDKNEVERLIKTIEDKCAELNALHPRCHPMRVYTQRHREEYGVVYVGVSEVSTLGIYEEREATNG